MEESIETRLPAADALPDGFVETFSDPFPPSDEVQSLPSPSLPEVAVAETEVSVVPPAQEEFVAVSFSNMSIGANDVETKETRNDSTDLSSKQQISGNSSSCSTNSMENHETKAKVGKRSKLEKELAELSLKYQKTILERDAAIAVRMKLESLCRELQRQNKMLMEECRKVSTEGQNMRLELSNKFSNTIKDVSTKLDEQKNECLAQLKENEMLRNKLKEFAEQYAVAEQQFAQRMKEKMLELELANLKMQQHQEISAQEQTKVQLYSEQVSQLMATEKSLRLQLAADGEKFQQFQEALSKSNEVFETYKQEMEKMVKMIKDLKKDNEFLKNKNEKSDIALVKLVEEREVMKKHLEKSRNQKEKLESLCRSLQAERKQTVACTSTEPSAAAREPDGDKTDTDINS